MMMMIMTNDDGNIHFNFQHKHGTQQKLWTANKSEHNTMTQAVMIAPKKKKYRQQQKAKNITIENAQWNWFVIRDASRKE